MKKHIKQKILLKKIGRGTMHLSMVNRYVDSNICLIFHPNIHASEDTTTGEKSQGSLFAGKKFGSLRPWQRKQLGAAMFDPATCKIYSLFGGFFSYAKDLFLEETLVQTGLF